jgi:hypothetical protein
MPAGLYWYRVAALTGAAMPRELSAEFQGKAGTCLFGPVRVYCTGGITDATTNGAHASARGDGAAAWWAERDGWKTVA